MQCFYVAGTTTVNFKLASIKFIFVIYIYICKLLLLPINYFSFAVTLYHKLGLEHTRAGLFEAGLR